MIYAPFVQRLGRLESRTLRGDGPTQERVGSIPANGALSGREIRGFYRRVVAQERDTANFQGHKPEEKTDRLGLHPKTDSSWNLGRFQRKAGSFTANVDGLGQAPSNPADLS